MPGTHTAWSDATGTAQAAGARTAAELAADLRAVEDDLMRGCDADAALAVAAAVEAAAEALGDVELVMCARVVKADMSERKGHLAMAVRLLWEVNRWAAEHDCRPLLARTHLFLCRTHYDLGDLADGLDHAISAVVNLDDDAPVAVRAHYLVVLANALSNTISIDAARERYRQAEALAAHGGEVELQLMALNNLAYGEYRSGQPEQSWAAIERMLQVATAHGRQLRPSYLDTITRVQIALGRHVEAEQTIQTSLARYKAQGFEFTWSYAEQLLTLAAAQRCVGATDRAQESLELCRAVCARHGHAEVAVRVQQEQAELHAAMGNLRAAFETYKAFHAAAEELRSQQRDAQARTRQALFEATEAREDAERFREQARRDPLTGLHNRRYVDEYLPALITEAAQSGAPLTVAMVDLDHFKQVNDTFSHDVGDRVLAAVAGLLRAGLGTAAETGLIARVGGEEFLVALPGASLADATGPLEGIRTTVRSYDWGAVTGGLPVTVSIGAASTEDIAEPSQSTLLAEADRRLYRAKRDGRDRVVTVFGSSPTFPCSRTPGCHSG